MFQHVVEEIHAVLAPFANSKERTKSSVVKVGQLMGHVGTAVAHGGQLVGTAVRKPGQDLTKGLGHWCMPSRLGGKASQTAGGALAKDSAATPKPPQACAGHLAMRRIQPSRGAAELNGFSSDEEIGHGPKPCTPSGEFPSQNGIATRR
eukprot:6239329-Prymnesium_polylepis.1